MKWNNSCQKTKVLGISIKVLEHIGAPTCIVGSAAVVGSREEGYQMALRKALKAVHHTLVGSHDHLQSIHLCSTGEDLLEDIMTSTFKRYIVKEFKGLMDRKSTEVYSGELMQLASNLATQLIKFCGHETSSSSCRHGVLSNAMLVILSQLDACMAFSIASLRAPCRTP